MRQEDDSDEPPYEVLAQVLAQRRYLLETQRNIVNVGLYVGLIASQVEVIACLNSTDAIKIRGQGIQRLHQARDAVQLRTW